jgi:short-subunit dehydrogenase
MVTVATLRDARVLLTGATGGIGQTIARRLSREGAQLVLTARRGDRLAALAEELGAQALTADLARREEVDRLLGAAGEIDVLIANAAAPATGRLERSTRTASTARSRSTSAPRRPWRAA